MEVTLPFPERCGCRATPLSQHGVTLTTWGCIACPTEPQQRRLDVAIALAGDPEVLFLDEPTTGFDPSARHEAWDVAKNFQQRRGRADRQRDDPSAALPLRCLPIGDHAPAWISWVARIFPVKHFPDGIQAGFLGTVFHWSDVLVVGLWGLGALLVTLRFSLQLGTAQLKTKRDSRSVFARQGSRLVPLGMVTGHRSRGRDHGRWSTRYEPDSRIGGVPSTVDVVLSVRER
jgi:hypothetical protein